MGFLDRLFGADEAAAPAATRGTSAGRDAPTDDERAVERYRYLLRTAPPETIEAVHREAFEKLTEEQRALVYEELSKGAGTGERPLSSEPATLARAATRAEMRQPGTLERSFGNPSSGFGTMLAGSLLGTVAGFVIGSALVSAFLPDDGGSTDAGADSGGDSGGDAGSDSGGDAGADSSGGFGDFGGGGGDFSGDFGF